MTRASLYALVLVTSILASVGAGFAVRALGYEFLTTGVAALTGILVACGTLYWLGRRQP